MLLTYCAGCANKLQQKTPVFHILDAVFNALKGVNLDFSHYDGALAPDRFLKCFAGDPAAIRALGLEKDTVYLVAALNDCTRVAQSTTYNFFQADITVTVRIIRVADGKLVYSAGAPRPYSGSNEAAAMNAGLQRSAAWLADRLRVEREQIQAALAGAERVFEVIDTPAELDAASDSPLAAPVRGEVHFTDVSFGYLSSQPIIKDMTLEAKAGQTIALVGPTGGGQRHAGCAPPADAAGQSCISMVVCTISSCTASCSRMRAGVSAGSWVSTLRAQE